MVIKIPFFVRQGISNNLKKKKKTKDLGFDCESTCCLPHTLSTISYTSLVCFALWTATLCVWGRECLFQPQSPLLSNLWNAGQRRYSGWKLWKKRDSCSSLPPYFYPACFWSSRRFLGIVITCWAALTPWVWSLPDVVWILHWLLLWSLQAGRQSSYLQLLGSGLACLLCLLSALRDYGISFTY